jgi:hypothetical protein
MGGPAWVSRNPHFGISIRSMRRDYAKSSTPALSVDDLRECRKRLREAFRKYRKDCATGAMTATEQRKKLYKIKAAARQFRNKKTWEASNELLAALNSSGVRTLVYMELSRKGHNPVRFNYELVHWTGVFTPFPKNCLPALNELAALDVKALVPAGGHFPDPALANAVAQLVPIWKKVTGRTAGRTSVECASYRKKNLFADWISEMHGLLGVAPPPKGRVLGIVQHSHKNA